MMVDIDNHKINITEANLTINEVYVNLIIYIEGYTDSSNTFCTVDPAIVKIREITSISEADYQIRTSKLNGQMSFSIRAKDIKGIVSPEENPEYFL